MKEFEKIISEIPQRRNSPWYSRLFAYIRAFFYGTSTDVELAKIKVDVKDYSQDGAQRVTTIGEKFFEKIEDKQSFLQAASTYIQSIYSTNSEEAKAYTKFLLYFCKDYLTSSEKNQEVKDLKETVASLLRAEIFVNDAELQKISNSVCSPI
ncbi:MAG: hypothetical protein LBD34_00325 [Puniceicoccales bacterium]|nr:hypothetical protein [Puniceicoccales bacterium]